jgi:hypothetical protein
VKQLREGTFLCQTKYTQDMWKKFGMAKAKTIKNPMASNGHIDLNEEGKSIDKKLYRSMIGSCNAPNLRVNFLFLQHSPNSGVTFPFLFFFSLCLALFQNSNES